MMKKCFNLFLLSFFVGNIYAQDFTPSSERFEGFKKRKSLFEKSIVKNLDFKNIGPTIMSGRVTDIEVNPNNSAHFFVAYASGGLWETQNNGTTFTPLFDHEIVMTIGDIAVDWANEIIYLGSGENNSSRSSYSGFGIFKGEDFGQNWTHIGLEESHHIGRIQINPNNKQEIFVAVLGKLYSEDKERGIYKSVNAGQTWERVLFINENCGGIDLIIDPESPNEIYASMWERTRRAWNFVEAGMGSGIYKSIDGGNNWKSIIAENDFPNNAGTGRIGISLYSRDGKKVLYAFLDNQNRRAEEEEVSEGLEKDSFKSMSKISFLNLNDDELEEFLRNNSFPEKYTSKEVKKLVKRGKVIPLAIAEYLEDANRMLFDTPVVGAELYRSDNGGISWSKTHEDFLDDIVFSYGYYFGLVRVDPMNSERVFVAGVPILLSENGGKDFKSINGKNVHVDHHALWVNPNKEGHIINGNDGGINISYDSGENWIKCNSPAVGQFYTVQIDMEEPYNVYGGFQDNGVWYAQNNYEWSDSWHQTGQYPYKNIMGGDGMQIMVDDRNPDIVYTGFQFGNYYRINKRTGQSEYITPKHDLGERPLRWNWQSPIWLSKHNQDIFYMGSNKFHRSMDQGESWETLSGDLTQGGIKGDVPYGTLSSIHESPLKFGLLYAGSDDGRVHVSKNGGNNWEEIGNNLPSNMWVSRIKASSHAESRVYLSLNGYRWDNFKAMLYISDDYGKTWIDIAKDLPSEPINTVFEDPENENLLYVGTDHGLYCSLDRGDSFMAMSSELPAVAVHDLIVHPREKDLIVATHGRSFYKANVEALQSLHDTLLNKRLYVFDLPKIKFNSNWGNSWSKWIEPRVPEFEQIIWLDTQDDLKIQLYYDGLLLNEQKRTLEKGLNNIPLELEVQKNIEKYIKAYRENTESSDEIEAQKNDKIYLQPGIYSLKYMLKGKTQELELNIE